jgi:hypothetical protein
MDPLAVASQIGKAVDGLLLDAHPPARAQAPTDVRVELVDAFDGGSLCDVHDNAASGQHSAGACRGESRRAKEVRDEIRYTSD